MCNVFSAVISANILRQYSQSAVIMSSSSLLFSCQLIRHTDLLAKY